MTGHLLAPAERWRGAYRATCSCGLTVYGALLWQVWEQHGRHCDAVRAASESRHPSRRRS